MAVVDNFEKLLTDFFSLYHPRQVAKVGAIAQEFKGQEILLLKTLCDRYKKSYKVIPGLEDALAAPAPSPVIEEPIALEEAEEEVEETVEEETTEEVVAEDSTEEEETVEEEEVVEEEEEKE